MTSKTRIAFAKPLTIPRLELLSCLLLSKLIKNIYESIRHENKIARTTCWADSKIAFYWIAQKYKDWKPWVQNRVNRINEVETVWKHVPGSVNPADIATREINLLNTSVKDEWFNGPQFLHNSESEWPKQGPSITKLSHLEMKTETMQLATKIEYKDDVTTLADMEKHISLDKFCSVTAFVYRFIGNLKNCIKNKKENLLEGLLTREEIKHTEHIWIKAIQEKDSASNKFIKIKSSLKLFIDDNGILRCQSHLCETENLSFNHCNPNIYTA